MTQFLLDSDICISHLRNRYGIAEIIDHIGAWNCNISQVTVAELRYGAECCDFPIKRHRQIDEFCAHFSVVPIDDEIIHVYAVQKANLKNLGALIPDFDLLIGATAMCHGLVLVTNNTKHFERIQSIQLENWMRE